jgi:hypothetical protein
MRLLSRGGGVTRAAVERRMSSIMLSLLDSLNLPSPQRAADGPNPGQRVFIIGAPSLTLDCACAFAGKACGNVHSRFSKWQGSPVDPRPWTRGR